MGVHPWLKASLLALALAGISAPLSAQQHELISGQPGNVSARAVINMQGIGIAEHVHNLIPTNRPPRALHAPMPRQDYISRTQHVAGAEAGFDASASKPRTSVQLAAAPLAPQPAPLAPAVVSPSPSIGFQAVTDDNTVIPPDVGGTVGPRHVMAVHNNRVLIQNRTGTILSSVSLNAFWLALGAPDVFDPKVVYDPYENRWIFSSAANSLSDKSAILLAVSQDDDPTGNWYLYKVDTDPSNLAWSDYPSLGFNKDWIVITVNMFAINLVDQIIHPYFGENIYVFSKTNLYAKGDGRFTLLQDTSLKGFTMVPAVTYDNDLSTMYLVQVDNLINNYGLGVSRLQISTITGPVGSEVLDLNAAFTPTTNAWLSADPFFLFTGSGPQLGDFFGIDLDDSRIQSVVYRNGSLWTTHTIFEPVDVFSTTPFHSAVQWWQLDPSGAVQQLGRVEDPTGTVYYAYPSLAVNRCNDVLLGYSSFSPLQYASGNYSFRYGTDPPNTMQGDVVLKPGEGPYLKAFGLFDNRWGDYSSTSVDPLNDMDMWTLQEYAALPPTNSFFTNIFGTNIVFFDSGAWASWWGKIDVLAANPNQIGFGSSAFTVDEASPGFATITVVNPTGLPGSIDYATSDGTALGGTDYLPASGTLSFAPGQTSTNFPITIYDNPVANPNKTINLTLSNPTGGVNLGCLNTSILTIIDDETLNRPNIAGEFVFSSYLNYGQPYFCTENETTPNPFCPEFVNVLLPDRSAPGAIITVVRTNGSTGKVLVDFSTEPGGSAIPGMDYFPTNGTLVFDDFQTSAKFVVPVASSEFFFFTATGFQLFETSVRLVLSNPRPAPEEEQARPGLIRPKLGNGSESTLFIFEINNGLLTFTPPATFTLATAWNIERFNYRTDEYPDSPTNAGVRALNFDVTAFPLGVNGNVHVNIGGLYRTPLYPINLRNPDPSVKLVLNAGSDHAESFGVPFAGGQVWPNPAYTDQSLSTITNRTDFWQTNFNLGFGGQCRRSVTLFVTNDNTVEFDEDFFIWLDLDANPKVFGPSRIATVTIMYDDPPAGALDREWNPDNASHTFPAFNATPGADGPVSSVAVQEDGKTVIGGDFIHVNSQFRNHIARMNADGSLDPTFQVGNGADRFVSSVLVYPTNGPNPGSVLIAGGFTSFNGQQRNGIARLLPDGTLDPFFNPGNGADGPIRAMVLQSDGGIVIAGEFTFFNDVVRLGFARLKPDGSLDLNFDAGDGADGNVWTLALQPDQFGGQKILAGGDFSIVNGVFRGGIARLNGNGGVDLNFDPGSGVNGGTVYALAVQSDRSIMVAGDFSHIDVNPRSRIARLLPDGPLDFTFDPGAGPNDAVFSMALQPDGKAFIGGPFTSYNSTRRIGLARVRLDGSLDTTFMDTAYNQFAGLINEFSFQPANFVNSIAPWSQTNITSITTNPVVVNGVTNDVLTTNVVVNDYVVIGGSFSQVGGNPSVNTPLKNNWTVFTRADKRTRLNVARLIGGITPGPGNATFDTSDFFVSEDSGTASVKVERTDGRLGSLSATFAPSNHLATAGLDYLPNNVPTIWPEAFYMTNLDSQFPTNFAPFSVGRVGSQFIQVPVLNDGIAAGDKTVDLRFLKPEGSVVLGGEYIPLGAAFGRAASTLTIADTDKTYGEFNFNSIQYVTNESGGLALITVIRTNGSDGAVSVDYFTRDAALSPATANVDYTPVAGKLLFPPGTLSRTFTVPITPDTAVEVDENIDLVLTNATGGAHLPGGTPTSIATATLTIIDDDFPPGHISFSTRTYSTNSESDGFATITVTRTGGTVGFASIQFATTNGTAIAPFDYLATNGVLSWNDGNSTPRTFRVPLLMDGLVEGPETVGLRLFDPRVNGVPNAGLLGTFTNATLVIQDSDSYGGVGFSQPLYEADENGGAVTITVIRTAGNSGTGSVVFTASPGSAKAGLDFVPTNIVLTFLPGETSKSANVALIDDDQPDGNKTVLLTLSSPVNVTNRSPSSATLVIVDNESFNEPAGSADVAFRDPLVDGPIYSIALQQTNGITDGRILVAGDFTTVNHVVRNRLARLLTNGVLDTTFDPGPAANAPIRATAVQADGRLVMGGFFTSVAGTNRNFIARLALDGKLDASFNPGAGADNPIYALVLQPDNKVIAGGSFGKFNTFTRPGIVRLNTNGSVDLAFNAGAGPDDTVYAIALQGDGKVLLGGDFTHVNGIPFNHLARLNANGSVDLTFTNLGAGLNGSVRVIQVRPDGRLLVGGSFTAVNGVPRNFLAGLNADGSLDAQFMASVSGADNTVYAIAQQVDGKILVAGDFTQFNGVTRSRVTRLKPDGTTDSTINFGDGADGFVNTIVLQPDRKILIGGGFTTYDGHVHNHIARLHGGTIVGPGFLTFSKGEFQVSESGVNARITVKRNGGTTGAVGVDFGTMDGTALGGVDYVATNGSLTFPDGETVREFLVSVIDNDVTNDDRFLNLALGGYSGGATSGPQPVATLVIVNDESAVGFSSESFSISENTLSGTATITLRRSYNTNNTVSVTFLTGFGGTATPDLDYVPASQIVTFFPGEVLKNVNLGIINDTNVEGNETVRLLLNSAVSNPSSRTYIDIPTSTLTIVDDDFASGEFVFSSPIYGVNEYEPTATITVFRTNGSAGVVSVQFTTLDGTATAGQDYFPTNGTLAFADAETVRTFTVPIVSDYLPETNETVVLVLSHPTGGASLGITRTATLTITNNELINGSFNFSATNFVEHESNQLAAITVTRSLGFSNSVSVDVRTFDLTATNGMEYVGATNTLTWSNDDRAPKTFFVTLITNNVVEDTKIVGLQLLNPTGGASLGGVATATLTILDDDKGPGNLGFSSANYIVSESSTSAVVTVRRTLGTTGTVSIICATVPGGTAIAGVDYLTASNTLVFLDGQISKTLRIPLMSSIAVENNKTVKLELSKPTGGANTNGQLIAATLTIIEDQPQAGSLDGGFIAGANDQVYSIVIATNQEVVANNNKLLVGGDFTLFNGLPRSEVTRLHLDGSVDVAFDPGTNVGGSVRVVGSLADGGALIGGSFTNVAGSALSYLARLQSGGVLSTNFLGGLSGVDNFVYAAALQTDGKVIIGGKFSSINFISHNFIARLNPDGTVDGSFNPTPPPDGEVRAILVQPDGKILIAGDFVTVNGQARGRIARLESDGTLDFLFSPGIGASSMITSLLLQGDGKIIAGGFFASWNGVPVGRIIRLQPGGAVDGTFSPGGGANEFVSALALESNGKVFVGGGFTSFNGIPRNRLARLNPNGSVDTTINFGSGANSFISTLALQSDRKILIGGAFTVFDGVTNNYIARLYGGENFGAGQFVFSATNYTVAENGVSATITVLRQIGSSNTVSVDFRTSNGTASAPANYLATSGTLVFGEGETIKTFTIRVFDDSVTNIDRTVNLTLSNPTGGSALGVPSSSQLSIQDNDSVLSFSADAYSVSENAGAAFVTVSRSGGSLGAVSVDYATFDGTAVSFADYFPVSGTLFFAPGQTFQTFLVPILNDTLAEGNETIRLFLTNAVGNAVLGAPTAATLTIVDDDFTAGSIGFSLPDFFVSKQAGGALITVNRTPGSSGSASVQFFTTDITGTNGIDYISTNGVLVFGDGELTKTFTVPIIDDKLLEPEETILLTLANSVGAALSQSNAVLTILAEDTSFRFAFTTNSVQENGGAAVLTVLRLGKTNGTASVRFATGDGPPPNGARGGSAPGPGIDYQNSTVVLDFADGQTVQNVSVPIFDDTIGEGNETVSLNLFNPTNGALLNTGVLIIVDNEDLLSLDAASYSVDEGASNLVVTVVRSGSAVTNLLTVQFTTIDGTALAGQDYTNVNGILTFNPFETTKSFSVPIVDDLISEGDETFFVQLTNVTGGATLVSPITAQVTILDNDAAVRFAASSYLAGEATGSAVISVTRLGATNSQVSVRYASVSGGTATLGVDYVGVSNVLVFAPGVLSNSFRVPIIDDTLVEGNETVFLRLLNPTITNLLNPTATNLVGLLSPSNAVLTIVDNDSSTIVAAGSVILSESIPNGFLDPGEQVTISFGLRNSGNVNASNLVATLLATNGVVAPGGPLNYGLLLAGGPTVSRTNNFTVSGSSGGTVSATFRLQDGATDLGQVTFFFTLGRARFSFSSSASIIINDFAPATPYPSTILVSNVLGSVTNVTVTLFNMSHSYPPDIDILLAGPQTNTAGVATNSIILMSDVGGFNNPISSVTLTFDDNATNSLTALDPIVSGTNRPSAVGPDAFDAPAPAPPYVTRLYDLCRGGNPNGAWKLFVEDDASLDSGFISGGWALTIETIGSGTPSADLSVSMAASAEPVQANQAVTYTLTVTNNGPAVANNVFVTNVVPASAVVSNLPPGCTAIGNIISCSLGTLVNGEGRVISFSVQPTAAGSITNTAVVTSSQPDLNPGNNSASVVSTVLGVSAQPSRLTSASQASGHFQSLITGQAGSLCIIDAASQIDGPWTPIMTNIMSVGVMVFEDTNSMSFNRRFYRVRTP